MKMLLLLDDDEFYALLGSEWKNQSEPIQHSPFNNFIRNWSK